MLLPLVLMNWYLNLPDGAVGAHKTKKAWKGLQIRGFFWRNTSFVLSHDWSIVLPHTHLAFFLSSRGKQRGIRSSHSWPCVSNLAFNSNHLMCTSAEQSKLTEQESLFQDQNKTTYPNKMQIHRTLNVLWDPRKFQ